MFFQKMRIGLVVTGMGLMCSFNSFASTEQVNLDEVNIEEIVVDVVNEEVTSYNIVNEELNINTEAQQFYGVGVSQKSVNADNLASVIANGDISAEPSGVSLGMFRLTSYCGCSKCNGKWAGSPTAYGTILTTGRTIAVDRNVIPLGSWVEINVPGIGWQKFRAEDTGSGVRGNHIDVYVGSVHQECYNGYYNGMAEVRLLSN